VKCVLRNVNIEQETGTIIKQDGWTWGLGGLGHDLLVARGLSLLRAPASTGLFFGTEGSMYGR
jgi:hypothetical protein